MLLSIFGLLAKFVARILSGPSLFQPPPAARTPAKTRRRSDPRFAVVLALLFAVKGLAQTDAPAADAKKEDPVEMSPFVVASSQDTGYQAMSTLAGTRLNTDLKDVGAAVSVYTSEFLSDINVTKIEDILTYTASTEGGGVNGNYSGIVNDNSSDVRDDPSSVNRVRALAQATRTRDFFPSDLPSDAFSFETVTISRGPNAILAGVGNAGGVIDAALRKATFKDAYSAVSRFGSYDSHREEAHLNKVIIPKRLALRLDLLNDDQNFRQHPAYAKDQRLYAAMTAQLIQGSRNGLIGRGTLRANFEGGKIEGVPPDPLTPVANLSAWFNNATGAPLPATQAHWSVNGALQQTLDSTGAVLPNNAVVQGFPLYRQWALIYSNPNSGVPGVGFTDADLGAIQGFMGTIPGTPTGPGGFLRGTGDINRIRAGYYRTHLSDRHIFDFYDNLLTGVFDFRKQHFNATDLRFEQLLLGGNAGFEGAYNRQSFTHSRDIPISNGNEADVYIDVNSVLSIRSPAYPNGIPNPNFGRPFVHTQDAFSDQTNRIDRDSYQLTAFYKHDFTRSTSSLVRLLGNHTLSGLAFRTEINKRNRTYHSTWDPAGPLNPTTSTGAAPGLYGAQVNAWFYIGPSLLGANSISDVRLQPINTGRPRYGQSYTLRVYDPTTKTFVTGTSTPLRVLSRVLDQKENVDSDALALQSHFLRNHLVTTVGWREDRDDTRTSGTPALLPNGSLDESNITFQPRVSQAKRSWTKSVVGLLPGKLPGDTEIRGFWNVSSNYNPVGQRRNIWNEEIGSPSASTEEYGVNVTTFHGKLSFKVNHYTTQINQDTVSGVGNPYTYISTMITRALGARDLGLNPADWNYPGFANFNDVALALFDTIPDRLKQNISAARNFNPHFSGSGANLAWNPDVITNLASTSNTISRGMEYEAIVNPTKQWRVSFSVAKNEAVKADVAEQELLFASAWRKNLETMFDGRLLNGARNPPTETTSFWAQYDAVTLAPIRAQNALSGTVTPEIRKWRANLVTRYDFRSGWLKGVNIGGAVRWQDRIAIGYPLIKNSDGIAVADVQHPYWGPKETAVDVSLGYRRKLTFAGQSIGWSVSLNVRNLNAKDELIPIAANADGSYGNFRIPPDRTWTLTNSFSF